MRLCPSLPHTPHFTPSSTPHTTHFPLPLPTPRQLKSKTRVFMHCSRTALAPHRPIHSRAALRSFIRLLAHSLRSSWERDLCLCIGCVDFIRFQPTVRRTDALWAENTVPWDEKEFACALERCNPSFQIHFYVFITKIYGFVPILSLLRSEFGSQISPVRGSLLRPKSIGHNPIIIVQNKNSGVSKHPTRKRLSSGVTGYMMEICCEFGANRLWLQAEREKSNEE